MWVGDAAGPGVERGWKGRGRERLRHYIEPQLFHTTDPAGWSTAPALHSLLLSVVPLPSFPLFLVWPFITQHSPLWLFSFYSHPRPLLSFFYPFLMLSLTSTLLVQPRACSHFRWKLKRVVTRWCAWVCFCLCVYVLGLPVMQPRSCSIYYAPPPPRPLHNKAQ